MLRDQIGSIVQLHGATILLGVGLYVVAPSLLLAMFVWLLAVGHRGASRDGLAMGLAVSTWTSACWLSGGYFGAWLMIPPWLLASALLALSGVPTDPEPWWFEVMVVVASFLLWSIAGRLLFGTVA